MEDECSSIDTDKHNFIGLLFTWREQVAFDEMIMMCAVYYQHT